MHPFIQNSITAIATASLTWVYATLRGKATNRRLFKEAIGHTFDEISRVKGDELPQCHAASIIRLRPETARVRLDIFLTKKRLKFDMAWDDYCQETKWTLQVHVEKLGIGKEIGWKNPDFEEGRQRLKEQLKNMLDQTQLT